jgi:hypothetical protein
VKDFDSNPAESPVGLAPMTHQVVDSKNVDACTALPDPASHRGSDKSANAGDENPHEKLGS